MNSRLVLSLASLVLILLLGCSGGGPATHSVSGVIMFDGQPVTDAQVGFIPVDGQANEEGEVKPASGQTDSNGRYTLTTYVKPTQQVKGAMAGSYKVTVTKGVAENRIVEYDDLSQQTGLPDVYGDATQTPLSATVTADGSNNFDFTLEPPP